jgi:hypothetical protein
MPLRLTFGLLALLAHSPLHAAPTPVPVDIAIEQPVYAGLPVWLDVNVHDACLEARYPASENPSLFDAGGSTVETLKDGRPAPASAYPIGAIQITEPISAGPCPGSQPEGSASVHRFPLHLAADLTTPGRYAVRWLVRRRLSATPTVFGQSHWLTFTVLPSMSAQREAWLEAVLAHRPTTRTAVQSVYVPSLLAAWRDPRVTRALLDLLCSPDNGIGRAGWGALERGIGPDGAAYTARKIEAGCVTPAVAQFLSMHQAEFGSARRPLLAALAAHLHPPDAHAAAALRTMQWLRPAASNDDLSKSLDAEMAGIGPAVVATADENLKDVWIEYEWRRPLSLPVRQVLLSLAGQPGDVATAAVGALCGNADPADLFPIAQLATRASLSPEDSRFQEAPGDCLRGYGARSIPLLRAILAASSFWGTRDNAAIALDSLDQPDGTAAVIAALASPREAEPGYVISDIQDRPISWGSDRKAAATAYFQARLVQQK